MEKQMTLPTNENTNSLVLNRMPLAIFKTEADLTGRDITKMSNFFDGYIEQMSISLRGQGVLDLVSEFPMADLGIVNEMIQNVQVLFKGNTTFIPDFDNLPLDVKRKLKQGYYTIGNSKQVDGNMRAVILDEKGTRVKDITLKKVINSPDNLEIVRNISNQLQMKQIFSKLTAIEEFQTYQIERDRDQQIIVPFLDARTLVLRAANVNTAEEQKFLLEQANNRITSALHSIYTDMDTSARALAKKEDIWLPDITGRINDYIHFIVSDLQIATKYIGVSMQILEYIGDSFGAQNALLEYQQSMLDFFEKPITKKGLSAALIIHNNYSYSKTNLDQWYILKQDVAPVLKTSMNNIRLGLKSIEPQQIYIVSAEDSKNEKY